MVEKPTGKDKKLFLLVSVFAHCNQIASHKRSAWATDTEDLGEVLSGEALTSRKAALEKKYKQLHAQTGCKHTPIIEFVSRPHDTGRTVVFMPQEDI